MTTGARGEYVCRAQGLPLVFTAVGMKKLEVHRRPYAVTYGSKSRIRPSTRSRGRCAAPTSPGLFCRFRAEDIVRTPVNNIAGVISELAGVQVLVTTDGAPDAVRCRCMSAGVTPSPRAVPSFLTPWDGFPAPSILDIFAWTFSRSTYRKTPFDSSHLRRSRGANGVIMITTSSKSFNAYGTETCDPDADMLDPV